MALSVGLPMQVISSHPMGLIGIAATVPGTFGIPNVPMDFCSQCWIYSYVWKTEHMLVGDFKLTQADSA